MHLAVRDGAEVLYLDRLRGPRVGADRQHGRARGCRCTRPASARCCSRTRPPTYSGRCWRDLAPDHAVHRHPAGHACVASSRAVRARRLRDDRRGDEPRCLLGRGADPPTGRRRRRARHRGPEPQAGPAAKLVSALQVAAPRHRPAAGPATDFRPAEVGVWRPPASTAFTGAHDERAHRRSPSSAPARPACCSPTCWPPRASSRSVVETRSEEYVASRIRAGILEQSTVDLLRACGLGDRLAREGDQHRGIYLQWPEERHHLDFVDLTGRSVWVYGQTEVQKDLVAARARRGQEIHYEVARHRPARPRDRPAVGDVHRRVGRRRSGSTADVVVGCDGSFGPSRHAVPASVRRTWEKVYPYSWLGDPRRRRALDRRADLRLAPRRLRAALDALGRRSPGSTCRCPTRPTSTSGPTTGSGTRSPPGSATARTAGR